MIKYAQQCMTMPMTTVDLLPLQTNHIDIVPRAGTDSQVITQIPTNDLKSSLV